MFSFELELKALSGLLQHPHKWAEISSFITDDDFFSEDSKFHISIFKIIRKALNNAESINDTILIDRIKNLNISFPDSIDPEEYIRAMQYFPIEEKVFENSVRELKKYTIRRKILHISDDFKRFANKVDTTDSYSSIVEGVDKIYNNTIKTFELGENKIINIADIAEDLVEDRGENPPSEVGMMSPYPTVNKIYGSLLRFGNITCTVARQKTGKELANYEKVLTPNGWINHGDVKVGDKVITPSGRTSNVTDVFPHPQKDIYRFTFDDGRTVDAGLEHLWRVWGRFEGGNWMYKVVDTEHIIKMLSQPSKKKSTYIDLLDNIGDVKDKDLPIDPYCLGALLGDGGFSSGNVYIHCGDSEVLDILESRIKCGPRLQRPGCEMINISTKAENYSFFIESGLKGCLSGDKFIPEEYLNGSRDQKLELIRGLFDTDGYVSEKGFVEFYTKSEKMAKQVQEIIWSLGGFCKIKIKIPTIKGKIYSPCHRMQIRMKDPSVLFNLKRKKDRAVRTKKCRLRINSIVKLDKKEDCSCIQIDDQEHLYITSNYIITHNTSLMLDFSLKASYQYKVPVLHLDNGEMSVEELAFRMVSGMSGVPMHLLESGKWRTCGYKDWSAKEVVERVRSVWGRMKHIKILYENVAGMTSEEICSLVKRIYYSEIGRGNPMILSFDYIKSDFTNLGKGSDWQFVAKLVHSFKQLITKDLCFDKKPCVAMLTSVQANRAGIVSNKQGGQITDDESIISLSDQIIQFVSHMFILRKKTIEEIVDEGDEFGTHKLICKAARHLGEDPFGHLNPVQMDDGSLRDNFINLNFDSFNVEDRGDLRDIVDAKMGNDVHPRADDVDDDDLPEALR